MNIIVGDNKLLSETIPTKEKVQNKMLHNKSNTITTFAVSDEKTHHLLPKENESPNVQPDETSGLPVETTPDMLSKQSGKARPPSLNGKIDFDYEVLKFVNITDSHTERWKNAYPAVDVFTELRQMEVWADTNRKNRKSDWQRFIINWLKRSQDKARPTAPSWKGGGFGRFGNSKPTHVGKTEELKGKYADQVDEVIYTNA